MEDPKGEEGPFATLTTFFSNAAAEAKSALVGLKNTVTGDSSPSTTATGTSPTGGSKRRRRLLKKSVKKSAKKKAKKNKKKGKSKKKSRRM